MKIIIEFDAGNVRTYNMRDLNGNEIAHIEFEHPSSSETFSISYKKNTKIIKEAQCVNC